MAYLGQIVKMMNDYLEEHEEDATRVNIPKNILNKLMLEFDGPMKAKVCELGWKALGNPPMLFGMFVHRGGAEIKVERHEDDLNT
ncbi:MAG: hypothetical protein KAT09_06065 [Candidatus Aegiribacteria sp.]|nr:hypothetical protein [Candidatus Aegiribacteria sp.]